MNCVCKGIHDIAEAGKGLFSLLFNFKKRDYPHWHFVKNKAIFFLGTNITDLNTFYHS